MIKVAIVGNIASGKSSVEQILTKEGFPVLDTDKVCHEWLVKADEIKERFAGYDVFDNGVVSREKLGRLVFSDAELKKDLENLLYPYVRVEIARFFAKNIKSKYAFVSAPQLYEAGMEDLFDKVLFICCDDELRLKRLIARNGYSEDYAKLRMSAQSSQEEKLKKADWVVYNNSTKENLAKAVLKLVE
jgi:dephospho-CoA kinase